MGIRRNQRGGRKVLDICFLGSHNAHPSPITTTKTSEEELTIREESATLREAKNKKFASPLAKPVRLL